MVVGGDATGAGILEGCVGCELWGGGQVGVDPEGGGIGGVLRNTNVLADGRPSRQPSTLRTAGLLPGLNRLDPAVPNHILW
jgi:hypothetical protein